eukprot:jgi/Mesvir1/23325/Mv21021-RA.1
MEWARTPEEEKTETTVRERVMKDMAVSDCEVILPSGGILIIPHDHAVVVSVKEAKDYMKGVGELIECGSSFSRYTKRLFIFGTGKVNKRQLEIIEEVCEGFNIDLEYDEDLYDVLNPTFDM